MTTFYCTNCDQAAHIQANQSCGTGYAEIAGNKFCYACAGYSDALAIGDPRVIRMSLYTNDKGEVVNWPMTVLGHVTHKTVPETRPQPVRFQVRMLDGSRWYGTGPQDAGDYIRLTRYKGR